MSQQLDLFDLSAAEEDVGPPTLGDAMSKIAWSYSRRTTLEQCVRRYYYEYYASNKRTAKADKDKATLGLLKGIKNRNERAGELLHLAIGTYFRKGKEGDLWKPERLSKWVNDLLRRDISYSQTDPDGTQTPPVKFPPTLLSEFYYRLPDALELAEQARERAIQAVLSFATNPLYESFRLKGLQPSASVERPFKLKGVLACRIDGKVDLAYVDEGKVKIVDWKIGADDRRGDDSLQLATYALWASDEFQCSPQDLDICKVFLGSSDVVHFDCDARLMATARARIMQDAERMASVDGYGQQAVVEAFSPCRHLRVCQMCPFLKVCPEGQETVYA